METIRSDYHSSMVQARQMGRANKAAQKDKGTDRQTSGMRPRVHSHSCKGETNWIRQGQPLEFARVETFLKCAARATTTRFLRTYVVVVVGRDRDCCSLHHRCTIVARPDTGCCTDDPVQLDRVLFDSEYTPGGAGVVQ